MDTNVSLSGMNAIAQNVLATANGTANLRAEDSQARQANNDARPTQQVQAPQEPPPPPDRSDVQNMQMERDQMRDETAYTANATVISAQNQMGVTMDLRA